MTKRQSNLPPKCFFCMRVTTGTIILASLFLVSGIACSIFSTLMLTGAIDFEPSQYLENEYSEGLSQYQRSTLWIGLGNGLFLVLVSVLAIYGTVKSRSGYLLPMFILQVFEFLCLLIFIGGVIIYWPSIKLNIMECKRLPEDWKRWLLSIDDGWLACIVFGVLLLKVLVRCYLITMVYKCYKHITTQVVLLRRASSQIPSVSSAEMGGSIYKPPSYDDIQKVPLVDDVDEVYDTKPPVYQP